MLVFEEAEGSEQFRLGHRPCSAFGFVPMRNTRWPVSEMPYVTGSDEDVKEIEEELLTGHRLRAYFRRHSVVVSPTMALVQDEQHEGDPARSFWVPFADARPLWDVYTNTYSVPSGAIEVIPWPDAPRDVDPEGDHSIIDPVFHPVVPLLGNGTVGGQARFAFSLAHLNEAGGVLYVVATDEWKPFQGRYVLRSRESLADADDVRAIYVCPSALP
ncbi:MAG: hypothetical protein AAFN41_09310, partial [Planctomycetota bacterium]